MDATSKVRGAVEGWPNIHPAVNTAKLALTMILFIAAMRFSMYFIMKDNWTRLISRAVADQRWLVSSTLPPLAATTFNWDFPASFSKRGITEPAATM
jgi:hypothetical protein